MNKWLLFCLALFCYSIAAHAQMSPTETPTGEYFLRNIMGAKLNPKTGLWILPDTSRLRSRVEDVGGPGHAIRLDSFCLKTIGDRQEAWVLFTVEGHAFNFARLEKSGPHWWVRRMRTLLHVGAPGEYAYTSYGIELVGGKTFISIHEQWYAMGRYTDEWLLYDPFTLKQCGRFVITKRGEKEQSPEAYADFETVDKQYLTVEAGAADIQFVQMWEEKLQGMPPRILKKTLRYHFDNETKVYVPVGL